MLVRKHVDFMWMTVRMTGLVECYLVKRSKGWELNSPVFPGHHHASKMLQVIALQVLRVNSQRALRFHLGSLQLGLDKHSIKSCL